MSELSQDWVVPRGLRLETPHAYQPGDHRVRDVELAVIHFTCSPCHPGKPHGSDEARVRRWLAGKGRESGTHLVSLRDGGLLQGSPLSARPWHAGGSIWRGEGDVNQRSIGLDLENVGPLSIGTGRFVTEYGGTYHGPTPVHVPGYWGGADHQEPYRVAQMVALLHAVALIVGVFPVLEDVERWTGHELIRRGKGDPGPAFPWGALLEVLQGVSPGAIDWDQYDGVVDA